MKTENTCSLLYFACAAFILLLAIVGNVLTGQKSYLTGKSRELYEQLGHLRKWEGLQPSSAFTVKSTRLVTPQGIRSGAILVGENGVIEDIVDMTAVPPNWGPVLDYGRLLVMPGMIDIQNFDESVIGQAQTTTQDGITSQLVYISDEIRDNLLLNNKSMLAENFQWNPTNDSLMVGYIFTAPNSTKSFFVNKEYFERVKWCANHSLESPNMPLRFCHNTPFLIEVQSSFPISCYASEASNTFQIPRISSLESMKQFCQQRHLSTPSYYCSMCLYPIGLETNFTSLKSIDTHLESFMDYIWNDYDCFEERNSERRNILPLSKNMYRLPLAWTIAELLGISLQTFHSIACEQPAKIFGLRHKGKLEKGYDADMVVWSPERTQSCPTNVCEKFEPLCQKMNYSLKGVVFETFVGGRRIFARN